MNGAVKDTVVLHVLKGIRIMREENVFMTARRRQDLSLEFEVQLSFAVLAHQVVQEVHHV